MNGIDHSALCPATFNNHAHGACECRGVVPEYARTAHVPYCECGRCVHVHDRHGGQSLVSEEPQ